MSDVDSTTPLNRCTKCGTEYPATAEYFQPRSGENNRLRATCRSCRSAQSHQRYLAQREERLEKARTYNAEHKEQRREYCREYRERRGDDLKRAKHEYYIANAEAVKRKAAEYRAAMSPEQREKSLRQQREYGRKKYQRPEEKAARYARERAYIATEHGSEMKLLHGHLRRTRLRGGMSKPTRSDLAAIRAAQTDKKGRLRCWWCGKPVKGTPHLDHKIALAAGGANDAGNLCYACQPCNSRKWSKSPAEFAGRLL